MKKYWKNDENKAAFEHARDLTAHHSKSFYISTRLLPREKQWATFGLYGFCRYADNLIDNPRERSVGERVRAVDYLHEAVSIAFSQADRGDAVLLAPACSSFDMFSDYAHRGMVFRSAVQRLSHG